jgi:hypothetical protein
MRKVLFVCAAVAVVAGAGAYLLVDQAVRHPESTVGRWTAGLAEVGARVNPFVAMSRVSPEVVHGQGVCPAGAGQGQCLAKVNKPEKPWVPVQAAPVEEPMEVIRVEEALPAKSPQVADRNAEEDPEPCDTPDADGAKVYQETGEPGGAAEESEPPAGANDADRADVRMPYADEDDDSDEDKTLTGDSCNWLLRILKRMTQGLRNEAEGECPQSTPSDDRPVQSIEGAGTTPAGTFTPDLNIWINESNFDLATPPFDEIPGTGTDGRGGQANDAAGNSSPATASAPDSYSNCHHEHGCPNLSCPYPHEAYPPVYSLPAEDKPTEQRQPAQAGAPQVQKVKKVKTRKMPFYVPIDLIPIEDGPDDLSSPTKLDTMEYRPSDGDEDAYRDLRF